jgi:hypothetical protein
VFGTAALFGQPNANYASRILGHREDFAANSAILPLGLRDALARHFMGDA